MTGTTEPVTRYQRRVDRVKHIVVERTGLSDAKALELAVHMVHELDTLPERVR
ncbi:DUF6307 family protein [Amycolatopsis sp. cg9]|uniref:DUF6307 family protein n=1 Tax=Amycolatopsis sp. cg9 TaxID=3238801 RepID=UPI0035252797